MFVSAMRESERRNERTECEQNQAYFLHGKPPLVTFEKLLLLLFFFHFRRIDRIPGLHLLEFLGRDLRKMADEVDQLPVVLVIVARGIAPRRHPGETNAVPDDGEQLSICQILRASLSHV